MHLTQSKKCTYNDGLGTNKEQYIYIYQKEKQFEQIFDDKLKTDFFFLL
jgi:hypothetical protein